MTPGSIEDICFQAEAAVIPALDTEMSKGGCEGAHKIYAACVDFCQKADLPYSSIRVLVNAWGTAPRRRRRSHVLVPATELSFDGQRWQAKIANHIEDATPFPWGSGTLSLDSRPAKMLRAVKTPGANVWTVRVVHWQDVDPSGRHSDMIVFDPWEKLRSRSDLRVLLTDSPNRLSLSVYFRTNETTVATDVVELYGGADDQRNPFYILQPDSSLALRDSELERSIFARFVGEGWASIDVMERLLDGSVLRRSVDAGRPTL